MLTFRHFQDLLWSTETHIQRNSFRPNDPLMSFNKDVPTHITNFYHLNALLKLNGGLSGMMPTSLIYFQVLAALGLPPAYLEESCPSR